jgi:hypothetical protein
MEVEPDLAHGDRRVVIQPCRQLIEVCGLVPSEVNRMQTVGWMNVDLVPGQFGDAAPTVEIDRGHDQLPDTGIPRASDDRIAIGVEGRQIEMDMAVDKCMHADFRGLAPGLFAKDA